MWESNSVLCNIFFLKQKLTCFWREAHFDLVHCFVSIFIFFISILSWSPSLKWCNFIFFFYDFSKSNSINENSIGTDLSVSWCTEQTLPEERVAVSFPPNIPCPALSTDVWTPFRERLKRAALGSGQRVCEITKIGKLCVCWGSGSAVALAAEPGGVTRPPQTQGPVHSWLGG